MTVTYGSNLVLGPEVNSSGLWFTSNSGVVIDASSGAAFCSSWGDLKSLINVLNGAAYQMGVESGQIYEWQFDVSNYLDNGGSVFLVFVGSASQNVSVASDGTFTGVLPSSGDGPLSLFMTGEFTGTLDNFKARKRTTNFGSDGQISTDIVLESIDATVVHRNIHAAVVKT